MKSNIVISHFKKSSCRQEKKKTYITLNVKARQGNQKTQSIRIHTILKDNQGATDKQFRGIQMKKVCQGIHQVNNWPHHCCWQLGFGFQNHGTLFVYQWWLGERKSNKQGRHGLSLEKGSSGGPSHTTSPWKEAEVRQGPVSFPKYKSDRLRRKQQVLPRRLRWNFIVKDCQG